MQNVFSSIASRAACDNNFLFVTYTIMNYAEIPAFNKVQGFFICHMINYTGYNQKWNVGRIRSAQWTVQRIKKII